MLRLKHLAAGGRLAVSLFCITVLAALASATFLVVQSTGSSSLVDIDAVKQKYTQSLLVGAMWGSMYDHVTEDESIHIVERWIAAGTPQDLYEAEVKAVMAEDCTNCHSRSSTMTKAMPSIPLTSFEDVVDPPNQFADERPTPGSPPVARSPSASSVPTSRTRWRRWSRPWPPSRPSWPPAATPASTSF